MSQALHNRTPEESLPWYRYGMVWLVILLPLSVVVASMFTIALAVKNAPVILTPDKPVVEAKITSSKDRSEDQLAAPATN